MLMQADPTASMQVIRVSLLRDLIHHFPTSTSATVATGTLLVKHPS